jgi:hypothetical protein
MEESEVLHTVEGIDQPADEARGLSLLREAERKRSKRESSLFLDIPTWDGLLIGEYRVPDPEQLRIMAQRVMRQARNGNEVEPGANDISLIVTACVGLYARDSETGERVAIEDEYGHVGYNRIAHVLGKEDEITSNREAVKYLMGERDEEGDGWVHNVVAVSMHADKISKWMRDPSKRGVDIEELLGEF